MKNIHIYVIYHANNTIRHAVLTVKLCFKNISFNVLSGFVSFLAHGFYFKKMQVRVKL